MTATWWRETLHDHYGQSFEVSSEIDVGESQFQSLRLFDNPRFGKVLALDGAVQVTEADEFVYHEMMAHTPIMAHGAAKRVLILGGGDGGILREVLRHPSIEQVTLVEIDAAVIALAQRHLSSICRDAFSDPRAQIVIDDAARFVAETDAQFDCVIVDSTDPVGPAEALFDSPFYAACKSVLTQRGILVTQNGVPFFQPAEATGTYRRLSRLFPDASFYVIAQPTYIGGFMTLGWASLDPGARRTSEAVLSERWAPLAIQTRYYSPAVHRAAFALPPYIQALMGA